MVSAEMIAESCTLIVICAIAFFGNVSLWVVILKSRDLKDVCYYMVLILSSADILVSSVSMPLTIHTIIKGDWLFSDVACKAIAFLTMLTFIASVMSLGAISIHRYIKICHPNIYKKVFNTRNTFFIAAGVWGLSFVLALPPFIGWGKYAFLPNQSFCFCYWRSSVSYTIFMITVCFGGPFTVMSFCYFHILRTFRRSNSKILNSTATALKLPSNTENSGKNRVRINITSTGLTATPSEQPKAETTSTGKDTLRVGYAVGTVSTARHVMRRTASRRRHDEFILTLSLLLVIVVFVICWLPFCITMFITVFSSKTVPRGADMFSLLLGYANSCCNPFIYGLMNSKFKKGYRKLFAILFRPCRMCITFDPGEDLDQTLVTPSRMKT